MAFFERVIAAMPAESGGTLHVGGRLGNDVRSAVQGGAAEGPGGTIQQHEPDADAVTTVRIASLAELPEKIAKCNAGDR